MTRRKLLRQLHDGEDGQLLLLMLCYTVIAALLVTVVVNVSKAYLYRRALVAAADGAALTAANEADLAAVYAPSRGSPERFLPLDEAVVADAVEDYAGRAQLDVRFESFEVVEVSTNGTEVTVTLRASITMPFLNVLSSAYADGYPVHASATARSPVER